MTDIQELLDLEDVTSSERPCESILMDCDQPAEWLAIPSDGTYLQTNGIKQRDQCLCDFHKNTLTKIHYQTYGRLRVRFVPLPGTGA